ncbi:hypothetical protein LIA77_03188 [Sarocladium implicatum]|nr:hypothetical protein LIA77_03188 [Sarocladium implicatum]
MGLRLRSRLRMEAARLEALDRQPATSLLSHSGNDEVSFGYGQLRLSSVTVCASSPFTIIYIEGRVGRGGVLGVCLKGLRQGSMSASRPRMQRVTVQCSCGWGPPFRTRTTKP